MAAVQPSFKFAGINGGFAVDNGDIASGHIALLVRAPEAQSLRIVFSELHQRHDRISR